MLDLFAAWIVLSVLLLAFAVGRPGEGGALTLAYFFGMSMIHIPGALPYVFSEAVPFLWNSQGLADPLATRVGFEMTIIGMAAFVGGAIVARTFDPRRATAADLSSRYAGLAFRTLGRHALIVGALAYFLLIPPSKAVPSLTAIVSAAATLLILGLWVALYGAYREGDSRRVRAVLAVLPVLPLATLATGGFLGYGVYWVLSVLTFWFVISRRRLWFYLVAPLALYLGLSLFVSYMVQRQGIRDLVWNEHSTMFDRLDRISKIATDFQLLDLGSPVHISALDGRLNQSVLVGLAVQHIASGWAQLGYGDTVSLSALIPRAVWPDKPVVGGGLNVVSRFTGLEFDASTSVGAGQVLEFYVNFGLPGVLIGFALLGFGLMWLDRGIMRSLATEDMRGVLLRALPGIMMLQPGGNLLEIMVGIVATIIVAHVVVHVSALSMFHSAAARGRAD